MSEILLLPNRLFFGTTGLAASLLTRARLDWLAMAFGVLAILFVALFGWVKPAYNWDMAAYVATALENRYEDAAALHRETWDVMRAGADEGQMHHLTAANSYNEHQYANPEDFKSQLSMYRVKIAYIEFIRMLEPVFGIARATIASSVIFTLVFGLVALVWLRRENAIQAMFLIVPVLLIGDYMFMTIAVIPDMMLAAFSLAALYLIARGRDWAAAAVLFFSLFVRPDNIILVFALLIAATVFAMRVLPMFLTFVVGLVAVEMVAHAGGHPGWWPHFWFSCIELQNSMANFHPDFSLQALMKGYERGVSVSLRYSDWPSLFALLLAGWALLARAGKATDRRLNMMLLALAIGLCGKFVSFPLPDDRFYFVFISGMAVILGTMWKPDFSVLPRGARP